MGKPTPKRDTRLRNLPSRIQIVSTAIAAHAPKRADAELLTPEHRAWRLQVMTRAGWRCEAVDHGYRCMVAHPARLFADHVVERKDGGALGGLGMCLCASHHAAKTMKERANRMARRT